MVLLERILAGIAPSCLVLACIGLAAPGGASADETVRGGRHEVLVIDGDTLQIGGRVVQLAGIDAPEMGQVCVHGDQDWHCGLRAAYALHKLVELAADPIVCSGLTAGDGGIPQATCEAGTENLALTMLRSGYAAALPSVDLYYRDAEARARDAGLGLWGGRFVVPWEWRQGKRLPEEERRAEDPCMIHGKAAGEDGRLYYVPMDPEFDGLTIDPAVGDRVFCSDEEARKQGWRRPAERADGP